MFAKESWSLVKMKVCSLSENTGSEIMEKKTFHQSSDSEEVMTNSWTHWGLGLKTLSHISWLLI